MQSAPVIRLEVRGFILPGLIFFQQQKQPLFAVRIQQFKHIRLVADPYGTRVIHFDEAPVRVDKAPQGVFEGMEAAFQALDQNALHKAAHVALGLPVKFAQPVCQKEQRRIAGIGKTFQKHDRFVKNLLGPAIELINDPLRFGHFRKPQALLGNIF